MTDHMPDDLSATGRDPRAYTDGLRPRHGGQRGNQQGHAQPNRCLARLVPDGSRIEIGGTGPFDRGGRRRLVR